MNFCPECRTKKTMDVFIGHNQTDKGIIFSCGSVYNSSRDAMMIHGECCAIICDLVKVNNTLIQRIKQIEAKLNRSEDTLACLRKNT